MAYPSVTSDLAGFGDYVINNIPNHQEQGMFIVNRKNKSFHEMAEDLSNTLFEFAKLSRRERIALRYRSEEASQQFGWKNLRNYYDKAYEKSCKVISLKEREHKFMG